MNTDKKPVCMTIAGLDPSGGAGILADIKTFSAFACFGTAAVTSVTFQNTLGVFGAEHQSADSVERQIQPIFDDLAIAAVKTGMLPTTEIIERVAEILSRQRVPHLVVDPVVRSTSGFDLIDQPALEALISRLFPLADLVTPNLVEAERIVGFSIDDEAAMRLAANQMLASGAKAVLIKGGHPLDQGSEERRAVDRLYTAEGVVVFDGEFIDSTATHGTGCVLSAAITASLANGLDLKTSVEKAKVFVTNAILTAPGLGHGHSPTNI